MDTEIDLMFTLPGILLSTGTQHSFTKIIMSLHPKPIRKSTNINLDRIRCSVAEYCDFLPTDEMIWKSIRAATVQRLTRIFLWKCIHNTSGKKKIATYNYWTNINTMEVRALCPVCAVTHSMEHIALDCYAPASGQKQIWSLARELWEKKYDGWPRLNWGLILGCNLIKFKSPQGKLIPEKARLFAILTSVSFHLIWRLYCLRRYTNNNEIEKWPTETQICNQWILVVNQALRRDCILTDSCRFGASARQKELVLRTWSGILMNEDSLPDNWLYTSGVLVGMQPIKRAEGIG
ncbi:hypothetical protein GGX14DRAFT_383650 [Mycena pura]|uniref:Reverse transcriptase zinc-binding domain-containing protein n=1 Tax=Mycena pura TaxID=153505 RepID=A0AAD6ULA5_9AGAR|nr:hypothetical protein GGX14DRAFT_383650 [Mycena pura]